MKKEILALQALMEKKGCDAYLVETADFHQSEYVGDYFKARAYLSGFTGSAGTLLVTKQEAFLWTDGRYFVQAEKQLENSGIELMRMGQPGVPTVIEKLAMLFAGPFCLGADGRTLSYHQAQSMQRALPMMTMALAEDLVDEIWPDRPALSCQEAFDYDLAYCGESREKKLARIRTEMRQVGAESHLVTSLDDIAWILNIRGHDVACNPVVLSYLLIEMDLATLYVQTAAMPDQLKTELAKAGVTCRDYFALMEDLVLLDAKSLLFDPQKVNAALLEKVNPSVRRIEGNNSSTLFKAIKNEVEIAMTKEAHLMDSVAVTKFMYWLKNTIRQRPITELEASDHLEKLRAAIPGFIDLSFTTIAAYQANAAMMHYSAKPENQATMQAEGMLLVDSGGQYLSGTTDITRTFVLGDITAEQRHHFTLALKSLLRLQNAHFLYGCTGLNLDILARGPLWDEDLDYQCGTGHGVGHLLNVHEGPNGIRWKVLPNRQEMAVLEEGMITTDEPGVYIPGSHGVRHENELLCVKGKMNDYGQFMHFEVLTFTPIDLDGVDPAALSHQEKEWLNAYHAEVYEKLSPYMSEEEKVWLKEYTREI